MHFDVLDLDVLVSDAFDFGALHFDPLLLEALDPVVVTTSLGFLLLCEGCSSRKALSKFPLSLFSPA